VTILTRLFEKNVLSRERDGHAFRYSPVTDEAGLAARRLTGVLDAVPDRRAVLSRFIEDLSDRDEQLLRSVLRSRAEPPAADTGISTDTGRG
jgi:predicted transcriptional regulator